MSSLFISIVNIADQSEWLRSGAQGHLALCQRYGRHNIIGRLKPLMNETCFSCLSHVICIPRVIEREPNKDGYWCTLSSLFACLCFALDLAV